MNKIQMGIWLLLIMVGVGFLQSCKAYKNIAYFKDIPDSARMAVKTASFNALHIQKGDILNINVMTIDPAANAIFNQVISSPLNQLNSGGTGSTSNIPVGISVQQPTISGYVIDSRGEIELPLLGKFKAEGLTTDSLRNDIQTKAEEYYKTPAISVHFANLKVNILGEVMRPGTYNLANEKNTILDALGMAGDLTIYGKRENILLIRDSSGYTSMNRFSLNSKDLVKQNFYYLKQNDVIYVEPGKEKIAALDADKLRMYSIGAALLSVLIVLASRIN
jgi:polysaccharide export outer membrane protein